MLVTLPTQLWTGSMEPQEGNTEPVSNMGFIKPEGGLWTSTLNEQGTSPWLDFLTSQYQERLEQTPHIYHLTPGEANIFEINTLEDLKELIDRYPQASMFGDPIIDYKKMSNEWDGLHLSEQGQWATRRTNPNLYGWDVECTLWFNWAFDKVERQQKVKVPRVKPDRGLGR